MNRFLCLILILFAGILLAAAPVSPGPEISLQENTPVPTVTGTPEGPMIIVPDQVNVRTCPSIECDLVGVLIAGQRAPAIGRSPGGDWIQIVYAGVPGDVAWVYSPNVVLEAGPSMLPIVEPPPTQTPRVTATIDPTLAAQFTLGNAFATRLPTFTPAPPVAQPTFETSVAGGETGFPPIIAILALLIMGLFGMIISVLRGTSSGL
jgi:hypothetical protein